MIFNNLTRKPGIILIIYLALWGFMNYLLSKQVFIETTGLADVYNSEQNVFSVLNNHLFWTTWLGVIIRVLFEILLVSGIIFFTCKVLNYTVTFRKCLIAIIFAHCIFLLQFLVEFLFLKSNSNYLLTQTIEDLSLFSISYYLKYLSISYSWQLDYLFQTLNLFELIYWFLMALFLSVVLNKTYKTGFKLVAMSYIPILFIWLLSISFLLILFSK